MSDFESMNEMLIACVKAIGGSKVVGPILFPDKVKIDRATNEILTEPAQRFLLNCLDFNRAEKLSPDQSFLIIQLARDKGIHIGINYICESLGYSIPNPIEPEDEKAELMREFIESQKAMTLLAEKLSHVGLKGF